MGNLGPLEIVLIGAVLLLFFGAGRIADLGKGLGQGISNFKKGLKDGEDAPKADEKKDAPATPEKKEV